MKDSARPSNMFLFHANEAEYIEESTSQTIASWISSHRKATANSVKKWAATSQNGETSIVGWMRGEENNEALDQIHARQRQEFLHGKERGKKDKKKDKKKKEEEKGLGIQPTDRQL